MQALRTNHGFAASGIRVWPWRWLVPFERKLGTFNTESDRNCLRNGNGFDALAIYVSTITAIEIADAPLAVCENYLGMGAIDVVIGFRRKPGERVCQGWCSIRGAGRWFTTQRSCIHVL